MALTEYRLLVNGNSRSLADWGIDSATLKLGLCGDDSLSVSHASSITAQPIFPGLATAELFADGRRIFRGVVFPRREGYRMSYEIQGANYYLGTTIVQDLPFLVDDTLSLAEVSKYVLGRAPLSQSLTAIVDQVADQGAPVAVDFSLLPAPPDDGRPLDAQRDLTALDAIGRTFAYSPYLTWYWDYRGEAAQLTTCSVLRAGHGFEGLPANSDLHTVSANRIEHDPAPTFNPRYDLLKRKVVVYYQGWQTVQVDSAGAIIGTGGTPVLAWKRDKEEATVENGAFGHSAYLVELTRGAFNGTGYDPDEPPLTGLAARLLAPYATLWLEMAWSELGEGCNFDVHPGQLWSALGVDPAYAAAQALCRSVTHDLAHGRTRIECGPPNDTLGFMEPRIANRIRTLQNRGDSGGTSWGFEPDDQDAADAGSGNLVIAVPVQLGSEYSNQLVTIKGTGTTLGAPNTPIMVVDLTSGTPEARKVKLPLPTEAVS